MILLLVSKKVNTIHNSTEQQGQLTIRDIARLSGVSTATVSRLFHNPSCLKPDTKAKIEAVIEKHQYIPNLNASALTTKNTMTVGLIIPTVKSSIHSALIQSVQDTCAELGYSVIMGNTNYSEETEKNLLDIMLNRRVTGIIHAGTVNPKFIAMLRRAAEHSIPSVVVWENISDNEISSVGIDNYRASYDATQYLIDCGHKDMGLLLGPYTTMNRLAQRRLGFMDCMNHNNLYAGDDTIISLSHEVRDGVMGAAMLIGKHPRLTAIYAASDVLAFGALYSLRQMGRRVPKDISLVGFDNIEFSEYCIPSLTTVNVPAVKMGKKAVFELVDKIQHNRLQAKHIYLEHEIIIRDSVANYRAT